MQVEAPQLGLPVKILYADTADEIDVARAKLAGTPGAALMVSPDALFTNLRAQIVALAAQHTVPTIYPVREFPEAGGLMSYGPNFMSTYHRSANTRVEYSKARNPPTCRSCKQLSSSW
jgi:putative ABC transport system substrate-binding protein